METDLKVKKRPGFTFTPGSTQFFKYAAFIVIFSFLVFVFSLVMAGVSSIRSDIYTTNYDNTLSIYNGPLQQRSPQFEIIDEKSNLYIENNLNSDLVYKYLNNTFLKSTKGSVVIKADFVKKGLSYQPTYKTEFNTVYILKNNLKEESIVSFQFPLPINHSTNEISNAKIIVNGEIINDSKTKINYSYQSVDGLKWDGKIPANGETVIEISYNTIGISSFTYDGIENTKGAQDLAFKVRIEGTRAYDVLSGLSVDSRTFGDNFVELEWQKPNLYSKPTINIAIGEKLNPSEQVSRVYLTMTPIYIVFITIITYLAYSFAKKFELFDLFLISVLFTLYFPFIHYLSSFTIDPTVEFVTMLNLKNQFSMPIYLAFLVSWVVIGGIIYYLIGRVSGFGFATKFGLPSLILFIGFFPLVVTVPEYSMLLVLVGVIALVLIIVQVRIKQRV